MEKKATAPTKERLTKLINEYFYSKSYIITDDNRVYNTAFDKYINAEIKKEKNKFAFYY